MRLLAKNKVRTHVASIGLKYSETDVHWAYVLQNRDGRFLRSVDHLYFESGQERSRILKKKIESMHAQGAQTTVLLPQSDYQIYCIEVPKVPDHEKHEAIRWRISGYIDFPIEELIVDYIELPYKTTVESPHMVYVVVTRKDRVEASVRLVQELDLKLKAVDIYQSALKHIAFTLEDAELGQALLHVEEEKSYLILFKNKILYMMRDVDLGLKNLDSERNDLSVEIQRSLDYCASNIKNAEISRLVLTPLSEKNPHLLSNLSNTLGLPVREIEYSDIVNDSEQVQCPKENMNIFALGAALSEARNV